MLNQNKKSRGRTRKKTAWYSSHATLLLRSFLFIALAVFTGACFFFAEKLMERHSFSTPQTMIKALQIRWDHLKSLSPPLEATEQANQSIDYVEYQHISDPILIENKDRIRAFIEDNPNSPLSITLRNRWLIFLAERNDWDSFLEDYQPTNQEAVECYYLTALFRTGESSLALSGIKRLWDAHYKMAGPCQPLFEQWIATPDFQSTELWRRFQWAIHHKDINSIQTLLNLFSPQEKKWANIWLNLREHPEKLPKTLLPTNAVGQRIQMDILQQWASIDVDSAIQYWDILQRKEKWSEKAQQHFYLVASLHLALQGDSRAEAWFAKVLPAYSTQESRAWQVRFGLMHQQWQKVLDRINAMPAEEQNDNIWQYWKARALEALGHSAEANVLYASLSPQRQYYGFLSAYRQHTPLAIVQYTYPQDNHLLAPYQQQIQQIQSLYKNNQRDKLLPLTRDLLNQLNPVGQYTLAHLFHQWGWDSEAMIIVNRLPFQDDLVLRFPMPHQSLILSLCQKHRLSSAFVYALARQESNFHNDVASQAGGIGLLQLTLGTAKQFDSTLTEETLYRPETNINISILYVKKLMRQFDEHPLLVASAYNAGPQKTRRWQPESKAIPADIWIETRPWGETRNYLKNTLAYYAVYQYLLGQAPDINAFMQPIPKP